MWRELCVRDALLTMRNRATSRHHVTSALALVRRMTLMEGVQWCKRFYALLYNYHVEEHQNRDLPYTVE